MKDSIKLGATMSQALKLIETQEAELNELRLEVRAFRSALNLNSVVRVNNDDLKSNMERELHKLSHDEIINDIATSDGVDQTMMTCVSNYDN